MMVDSTCLQTFQQTLLVWEQRSRLSTAGLHSRGFAEAQSSHKLYLARMLKAQYWHHTAKHSSVVSLRPLPTVCVPLPPARAQWRRCREARAHTSSPILPCFRFIKIRCFLFALNRVLLAIHHWIILIECHHWQFYFFADWVATLCILCAQNPIASLDFRGFTNSPFWCTKELHGFFSRDQDRGGQSEVPKLFLSPIFLRKLLFEVLHQGCIITEKKAKVLVPVTWFTNFWQCRRNFSLGCLLCGLVSFLLPVSAPKSASPASASAPAGLPSLRVESAQKSCSVCTFFWAIYNLRLQASQIRFPGTRSREGWASVIVVTVELPQCLVCLGNGSECNFEAVFEVYQWR